MILDAFLFLDEPFCISSVPASSTWLIFAGASLEGAVFFRGGLSIQIYN
jgi:hypothetical protein